MRARSLTALVTPVVAALALGLGATAAQADVSVQQSFAVPASGSFTISGHGFGHGHGMSQYGAEGAALQGLTAQQILGFYYPGTTPAQANPRVRVLLSTNPGTDLTVLPRQGLQVVDRGDQTATLLPTDVKATQWRLGVSGTKAVVSYLAGGKWHLYQPGGKTTLVGDGAFTAGGAPVTMVTGSSSHAYRGTLIAASPSAGSATRRTVNSLSVDSYLMGVVPSEMPASWKPAALQAQAVAARTYALWSRAQNPNGYYQICDTSSCQVYGGVGAEYDSSNAAVKATTGQYLAYQGKPAFTQFSSSSGGWTSNGGQPYLPHQADPYDDFSGNPVHSWSVKATVGPLQSHYPSVGKIGSIVVTRREGGGQWQGRVLSLTLKGSKGNATVSGASLQSIYGLRSTWFSFS